MSEKEVFGWLIDGFLEIIFVAITGSVLTAFIGAFSEMPIGSTSVSTLIEAGLIVYIGAIIYNFLKGLFSKGQAITSISGMILGILLLGTSTSLISATATPEIIAYIVAAIMGIIGGAAVHESSESGFKLMLILFLIGIIVEVIVFLMVYHEYAGAVKTTSYIANSNVADQTTTITVTKITTMSTSVSTTTIPQLNGCFTDPAINGLIPLNCTGKNFSPNTVSFNFVLNWTGTKITNTRIACTALPLLSAPPLNQFYPLQQNGFPDLSQSNNGRTIWPGDNVTVKDWPCYYTNIYGTFEEYIWINFSVAPGVWDHYQVFDISNNANQTHFEYNQTKNKS